MRLLLCQNRFFICLNRWGFTYTRIAFTYCRNWKKEFLSTKFTALTKELKGEKEQIQSSEINQMSGHLEI
jgi:hypothetical protein